MCYLWSREAYFSWRTIKTLWREGRMRDSCVKSSQLAVYFLPPEWMERTCHFLFFVQQINFSPL